MQRKNLSMSIERWENFKAEKLEKWLKPVRLEDYEEADIKYEEFIKNKNIEAKRLHELGIETKRWAVQKEAKRKAGFRAQKWFSELLFDIEVTHWADLKKKSFMTTHEWLQLLDIMLEIMPKKNAVEKWRVIKNKFEVRYDIEVPKFGYIEVKSVTYDKYLNIKKASWDAKPSTYLVAIKQCDEMAETFQFVGWLCGHEIFRLPVETSLTELIGRPEFYVCSLRKLKKPQIFLKKLFRLSRRNPKRNR